jgi:membrane-bound lytic murein transglycosylase D
MQKERMMLWTSRGLLVLALISITACKTANKSVSNQEAPIERTAIEEGAQVSQVTIKEDEVSSETVEETLQKPYKSKYGEIDLDRNQHVDKWIAYFQGRGRKFMETYLRRSGRYLPMMKNVLRENGLPEDLVYIALIESGFSPIAHSHANAVGYWQFIRGTGRRYGLAINPLIDERRDPVLSTRAAAEYFKALYDMFGSWHLAMSSYNVGENRVKRAVRNHKTRDLWVLVKKRRALPPETKNYVPKFIAATLIAKEPEKYGFTNIAYEDPLSYDTVDLKEPISLVKLSAHLNVDIEEMKLLNPKFRSDYVPITHGTQTTVRIPVGRQDDALAALSLSVSSAPKVAMNADYGYYRIRRGDNLSTIARKHRTTVSKLRRLNGLSNRTLLRAGRKLKVPDNGGQGMQFAHEEDANTPNGESTGKAPSGKRPAAVRAGYTRDADVHIVRRGENLTTIARRYGLTIEDIRRINNLGSRSIIRRGQKLRLRDDSARSATRRNPPRALAQFKSKRSAKVSALPMSKKRMAANTKRHVVRRGETLYDLSKRYGVAINRLAKVNGRKINYRVMAGEKLLIPD